MGTRAILVDGYNVIRKTTGLAEAERVGGLAAGREALLALIASAFVGQTVRIGVVFDGDGKVETRRPLPNLAQGRVIFSAAGQKADAVLDRLAASERQLGYEVTVVTCDAEVRDAAALVGATPLRTDAFADRLNRAPRDLRQRYRVRQGRQWQSARVDDDGEPLRISRKGNGHQAPRRRTGRGR